MFQVSGATSQNGIRNVHHNCLQIWAGPKNSGTFLQGRCTIIYELEFWIMPVLFVCMRKINRSEPMHYMIVEPSCLTGNNIDIIWVNREPMVGSFSFLIAWRYWTIAFILWCLGAFNPVYLTSPIPSFNSVFVVFYYNETHKSCPTQATRVDSPVIIDNFNITS